MYASDLSRDQDIEIIMHNILVEVRCGNNKKLDRFFEYATEEEKELFWQVKHDEDELRKRFKWDRGPRKYYFRHVYSKL